MPEKSVEKVINTSNTKKPLSKNKESFLVERDMSEHDRRELIYNLDRSKRKHKNTFTKWTAEQDQYLVNMHKNNSISDIANELKRTKSAISSRLRKLSDKD